MLFVSLQSKREHLLLRYTAYVTVQVVCHQRLRVMGALARHSLVATPARAHQESGSWHGLKGAGGMRLCPPGINKAQYCFPLTHTCSHTWTHTYACLHVHTHIWRWRLKSGASIDENDQCVGAHCVHAHK